MPVTGNSGQRGQARPMEVAAGVANRVLPFVAVLVGLVLIVGWLGGDRLVGDEHNAIHFLKDGFWDYMKSFHYGHTLKAQVWVIHALFGNSFFWYRIPAAVAIACFVVWLAFFRKDGLPVDRVTQALVVLFVIGNMRLLFFARWGMPNYGESILLEALLLGMLMPDVIAGRMPAWTKWRLLIMAVLPWVYPTTVILLGAVSTYLWLLVVLAVFVPGAISARGGFMRRMYASAVPLVVGGTSLFIYRLSVPDAHWNRARGLHSSFSEWVEKGEGGAASFVVHSLAGVGKEIVTLVPLKGGEIAAFVTHAYTWLGISIAMAIVVALAIVVFRALRLRGSIPETDRNFLRAGGFLAIVVLASTAVVLGAQLLNAFPTGGLRHIFFLIPALALLAVVSSGYLVYLAAVTVRSIRAREVGRVLASLAVVVLGGMIAVVVSKNRIAEEKEWQALFGVFHSPANDITFAFAPGFYVSPVLQPDPGHYFMVDAGKTIPGAVQQAVRKKAEDINGGRIAILVRRGALDDAGSALNAFIAGYGLRLERVARSGPFAALELAIPHSVATREPREIEVTVDLPASAIVSVRLDPTQFTESPVTVESIVLTDAHGEHVIDVCGDAKLQMVRTVRIGDSGGCTLVLGDASNTGWIAPSALRNLAASTDRRRLHIRMTGEFSDEFRVYFDRGAGYDSPVRAPVNDMSSK